MKEYPPSIIYIDVDMYSSTITILNWIDKITLPGTIIYFDERGVAIFYSIFKMKLKLRM